MRPQGIHTRASVGGPPESRDWHVGDSYYLPAVDQTALVHAFCTIDGGLQQPTRVGARSFLMARVHVGHDAQIGADCELAPGTVIGGHAVLEDGVRCGIGALVLPRKRVGRCARIGAGAVVTKDVPAGEVWVGNPARRLEQSGEEWEAQALARGVAPEWIEWVKERSSAS